MAQPQGHLPHEYGLRVIFKDSTLRLVHSRVRWLTEEIAVMHAKMALRGQTAVAGVAAPGERRTIFSFVVRLALRLGPQH